MLHFGRMNTDTAAACFLSVDDKVVCVCADTCKHVAVAAVDFVHILHVYAGERVVHRVKRLSSSLHSSSGNSVIHKMSYSFLS